MLYLICSMLPSHFARYRESRAKDLGIWDLCYNLFYIILFVSIYLFIFTYLKIF